MLRILLIVGVLFIAFGVISLAYEGVTILTKEKVAEIGPVEVKADRWRTIWFSPVAGGVALATGLVIVAIAASGQRGTA